MKLVAAALLLVSVSPAQKLNLPEPFARARTLYYRGADGDAKSYDEADKLFTDLYDQHAKVPRIEVYYGSLRLLEASRTWALWKKNRLSREGIELMDAAVAAAPDDLEIRFVRAATTYDLPGFFHRKEQSEQDFAYLARHAEQAVRDGMLEPRLAAASLYFNAEFLREDHRQDAIASWKKAIAVAPDSRAARDSEEELKKLGE